MRGIRYAVVVTFLGLLAAGIVWPGALCPAAPASAPSVEKQGSPATLLFVRTTPSGAEVRLDGKKLGKSDGLFPVDPGSYKIVVDLEGHQPHQQQITVRDGRITRIELTLQRQAGGAGAASRPPAGPPAHAHDAKLNEAQRQFRDWDAGLFGVPTPARWENLSPQERADKEAAFLGHLSSPDEGERVQAIDALAALGSKKSVKAILQIAADREEKNNYDRHTACRALGLLGDRSVVPELVHLTYHYNLNTRFWAQISLVRLTGENFGRDVAAWRAWWEKQGGTPPISEATVAWTKNAEWSDPKSQENIDREFLAKAKARAGGGQSADASARGDVPRIVATSPAVGATDVAPATSEITVTFDRDMGGGFSWTGSGPDHPPTPQGKNAFWRDRRTCVLPVKLEPARYYRVGINSTSFQNFKSAEGVPAQPSAVYFTTRGASEELKGRVRKPQVVFMTPPNGAKDVDPGLREIRVTFDVPMGGGFSWTSRGRSDPSYPKVPDGKRPFWTPDRKTCVLPVELKPGWDYRLGLNSPQHKNFQSEAGIPLEPVEYAFTTREK